MPKPETSEFSSSTSSSTLKDAAYALLSNLLIQGAIKAGQSISLRQASRLTGLGMGPVRDAISQLTAEGALQVMPNRTVEVPLLSRDEFDELYETRCIVEAFAVAKAAFNISLIELREIRQHFDRLLKALDNNDVDDVLLANREFQFGIYRASGSATLMGVINRLWLRFGPTLFMTLVSQTIDRDSFFQGAFDDHVDLIEALHQRDPERARRLQVRITTRASHLGYYKSLPSKCTIIGYESVEIVPFQI